MEAVREKPRESVNELPPPSANLLDFGDFEVDQVSQTSDPFDILSAPPPSHALGPGEVPRALPSQSQQTQPPTATVVNNPLPKVEFRSLPKPESMKGPSTPVVVESQVKSVETSDEGAQDAAAAAGSSKELSPEQLAQVAATIQATLQPTMDSISEVMNVMGSRLSQLEASMAKLQGAEIDRAAREAAEAEKTAKAPKTSSIGMLGITQALDPLDSRLAALESQLANMNTVARTSAAAAATRPHSSLSSQSGDRRRSSASTVPAAAPGYPLAGLSASRGRRVVPIRSEDSAEEEEDEDLARAIKASLATMPPGHQQNDVEFRPSTQPSYYGQPSAPYSSSPQQPAQNRPQPVTYLYSENDDNGRWALPPDTAKRW